MTQNITFRRGTTFNKGLPLDSAASYYAKIAFTVRSRIPDSETVLDDEDADVVATASTEDTDEDDGDVVATGSSVQVIFAATVTKTWPRGRLYYELKGITADGFVGPPIETGELMVTADYVRSVPETPAP
ncbi:MAG TPA: hypothetical protein VGK73_08780 [Polyangiaceae bacterium]